MRKFKFKGNGPVDVPALGLENLTPNSVVEVEDPAIADGMEGSELWEHVPDPKRSRAAKKAAATRIVAEEGPELVNLPRGSKVTPNERAETTEES